MVLHGCVIQTINHIENQNQLIIFGSKVLNSFSVTFYGSSHNCNFLARRILLVFQNFEKMRRGPAYRQGMCRYWPTPEAIYESYGIPPGAENVCDGTCSKRHCLPNICIQEYFQDRHFPPLRPLAYPTTNAAFEISADLT